MAENKSYRIHTNSGDEYVDINLGLSQDIDIFEMLTLKINSRNLYKLDTSNYGCIAGRVLANNAIGVPNVRVSVFIAADEETSADSVLSYLYPYSSEYDKNSDGIRYNLLTEEQISLCHQNVGTFPSKRLVLDDSNVFEIFDKYYKFTTTTNNYGDYMIFGVPTGNQILHMDVDLSDIGDMLSQTPRDFIYKGYDINEFESPSQFKKDTELDNLPQIASQNETVYVYPFWGDPSEMGESDSTGVRITRKDINLNYKFEPTCIFFGSIISDEKSNGISERCIPTDRMGKMDRLTTGEGTIEMIRKTPDGEIESFNVQGSHLIDGDGTWCYQIPMNLDFVRMDEFGKIVPTDDPNKGLPTRTSVRFRVSLNDFASDYDRSHLCKILVPSNPKTYKDLTDKTDGKSFYAFGTFTRDEDFRNLTWNNVYSVKSYIPRLQKGNANKEKRFTGIKAVNVNVGNNPIPYNNMRVDITFMFILQCAIMHILIWIATVVNKFIGFVLGLPSCAEDLKRNFRDSGSCVTVGDGACPDLDGWYFAPGCSNNWYRIEGDDWVNPLQTTVANIAGIKSESEDKESTESENKENVETTCVTNKIDYFVKCIELALAQEYEVIQFDFYNDWLNGVLYIPRWFAKIRKKRSFLFGLIRTRERVKACMEDYFNLQRRYVQQCAISYKINSNNQEYSVSTDFGCRTKSQKSGVQNCHTGSGRRNYKIFKNTRPGGGIVHEEQNVIDEKYIYYLRPCDFSSLGDSGKRINYFLTDIILLGSVKETNEYGIPQAFKLLQSSTYRIPTNLAATNMDTVGYMFGVQDGFACVGAGNKFNLTIKQCLDILGMTPTSYEDIHENSVIVDVVTSASTSENEVAEFAIETLRRIEGAQGDVIGYTVNRVKEKYAIATTYTSEVKRIDQKFDSYEEWASRTDFSYDTENDANEYPITEAAGIDWGYTGPEQEKFVVEGNKKFKPGGHFLGLSCFNAETNVKSCVNLSRVCEAGVSISSRKHVEDKKNSTSAYGNMFITPTGLISREEILDSDIRSMFATLNYNNLSGEFNENSGMFEYDFIPMQPVNFDGAFKKYIESNGVNPYNDSKTLGENSDSAFTKTYEAFDKDYVRFRFGIEEGEDIKNKFLNESGDAEYSLPMYENSFYFYFGLHDGETALDKFYERFYAECPSMQNSRARNVLDINVTCETSTVDICAEKGFVRFEITGRDKQVAIDSGGTYNIYEVTGGINTAIVENGAITKTSFYLSMAKGAYEIVVSVLGVDISAYFTVNDSFYQPSIRNIYTGITDDSQEAYISVGGMKTTGSNPCFVRDVIIKKSDGDIVAQEVNMEVTPPSYSLTYSPADNGKYQILMRLKHQGNNQTYDKISYIVVSK